MKKIYKILLLIFSVLMGGAFLSFVFLARTDLLAKAVAIGYFYAISIFSVFYMVHKIIAAKLSVFPYSQQLILRSFLYATAVCSAYLLGFVFQTFVLLPIDSINEAFVDSILKGFVYLVTSSFGGGRPTSLLSPELRAVSIPFFAMIFLIGMASLVGSFIEIRWQENKQKQALQKAELTALRSQIEPHFLFNSLNTIASFIRKDPVKSEQLVIQLSNILRYFFQGASQNLIELQRELQFTREYLNLLQARFGEMLQVKWQENVNGLTQNVPVLFMQPIIENSIRHGWQNKNQPFQISIEISEFDGKIRITISDNGSGIHEDILAKLPIDGHALANISERLLLQYNRNDLLRIKSKKAEGTTVEIFIPL